MIKNRLKKVKKEIFGDEEENIITIDLNDDSVGKLYDEVCQIGLGFSKKMILVYNSSFFNELAKRKTKKTKSAKKAQAEDSDGENETSEFIKMLDSLDEDTSVVFVITTTEIDKSRELYKYIADNGTIFELKELGKDEWPLYIKQYFQKREIKITDDAVEELVKRINGDLNVFNNEATKLLMYADDKIINLQIIEDLVPDSLDEDAFKMLNSLTSGKKDIALRVYRDLRLKNVEPMTLINMLATNLIYMLNVKLMLEQCYSNEEIAQKTGSSTGRVYVTVKNSKALKREYISNKIEELYELERAIKHSEVDRFIAFEMYLINF